MEKDIFITHIIFQAVQPEICHKVYAELEYLDIQVCLPRTLLARAKELNIISNGYCMAAMTTTGKTEEEEKYPIYARVAVTKTRC